MATREHLTRALWTLFEPIHAVSYFSPQAREAFAEIGFPRYWDGYFAGRSAPLGAVEGAPVVAIFSGFAPMLVNRALPAAWSVASPAQVLEARAKGAEVTLRALFPDEAAATAAADALAPVAANIDSIGRPLAAANAALPVSDDPYRSLWQSAATLREHRGDGHVLALVGLGIAGLTTLVLRSGNDLDAGTMQKARGWTDDEWAAEKRTLTERSFLDADGRITASGAAALNAAEEQTNTLALQPWCEHDESQLLEVAAKLMPIAQSVGELFPYPNPIGMPVTWDPISDPNADAVPALPAV